MTEEAEWEPNAQDEGDENADLMVGEEVPDPLGIDPSQWPEDEDDDEDDDIDFNLDDEEE